MIHLYQVDNWIAVRCPLSFSRSRPARFAAEFSSQPGRGLQDPQAADIRQVGKDDFQLIPAIDICLLHALCINGDDFRVPALIPILGKNQGVRQAHQIAHRHTKILGQFFPHGLAARRRAARKPQAQACTAGAGAAKPRPSPSPKPPVSNRGA